MVRLNSFILFCLLLILCSCSKLVDINVPPNRVSSENVYSSDATAAGVLTGLYVKLSSITFNNTSVSIPNISMWLGLSADELALATSVANASQIAYFQNNLSGSSTSSNIGSEFWSNTYPLIYTCNSAIEGLSNASTLTPGVRQQLIGEAKFLRAFFYFYLVNLYGDIPLVLSTDYTINASLSRAPVASVYQQIITDLKEAQAALSDAYVKADALTPYASILVAERTRPNKWAATALLARTYLYSGDYANAEAQASLVISNKSYYQLLGSASINAIFLKNSMEAIWQLQPVLTGTTTNTADAVQFLLTYVPTGIGSAHQVYLSPVLLNSFEPGDLRRVNGNWVNVYSDASGTYYYPYKYKNATVATGATPTEYTMILRLGEQYLIRAEARAQLNNLNGSLADLDSIRVRANLPVFTSSSKGAVLTAILHERQVELFTELGNRWLDIKRSNSIDTVMSKPAVAAMKGSAWRSYQQYYPIYVADILKDYNLGQNPGY